MIEKSSRYFNRPFRAGDGALRSVRPVIHNLPIRDADDTGRHRGDRIIVRDQDDRISLMIELLQEMQHVPPGFRVERACRLVSEDDRRMTREGASD